MSLQELLLALGGPATVVGIIKYLEKNAEMRVLSAQAQATVAAKDLENQELKKENAKLQERNEYLADKLVLLATQQGGEP